MEGLRFELITGPMGCGKTEELLRRLKRATIANKKVKVFSPLIDTRSSENHIKSRNGINHAAIKVKTASEILDYVDNCDDVIGIDEIQFFEGDITRIILELTLSGKKVIAAGLDLDFKSETFGSMPELYCFADKIDKFTAICMKCGSEYGNRTQRIINGFPADKSSPLIMIGEDEKYEARCLKCYKLPDKNSTKEEAKIQVTPAPKKVQAGASALSCEKNSTTNSA